MKHKIYKFVLIIILLIIAKSSWSQNTNLDYKYAFKFYNLTTYEEQNKPQWFSNTNFSDTNSSYYKNSITTLQILHPTIAFQWESNKNNFHEIELTSLILSKLGSKNEIVYDSTHLRQTLNHNDLTSTSVSIRYEYISNFNKSKETKFVPSIGFGFNPYYKRDFYNSKTPSTFSTLERYIGLRTFITPRLTYYLNTKLFIDVNIPICFFDSYFQINQEKNPAIPRQENTTGELSLKVLPNLVSGRIGVGVKL